MKSRYNSALNMKCKWEGCDECISEDVKEHIEAHFRLAKAHVCLWKKCTRYGEAFSNKYAFMAHLRIHTGEKPYACKNCLKCFSRADALTKHAKKHDLEHEQLCSELQKFYFLCSERKDLNSEIDEILEEMRIKTALIHILHEEMLEAEAFKDMRYWNNN